MLLLPSFLSFPWAMFLFSSPVVCVLQWLENCRKTFGDKDSNQRPDTHAQVGMNARCLDNCCCFGDQNRCS